MKTYKFFDMVNMPTLLVSRGIFSRANLERAKKNLVQLLLFEDVEPSCDTEVLFLKKILFRRFFATIKFLKTQAIDITAQP